MSSSDFVVMVLVPVLAITLSIGGCDGLRLSLVEDDVISLRRRCNDLELRINRVEFENKKKGEAAHGND